MKTRRQRDRELARARKAARDSARVAVLEAIRTERPDLADTDALERWASLGLGIGFDAGYAAGVRSVQVATP